ncbi:unnamed protein product [Hydatigera taeniaeformis]|uniref:Transmembrane protein n=1 Tax=Hydatigena taeniaeformis TaxID=6205 RepID=A0A0R3X5B4_HYDTA|nr:unnamed protein product [Hydatigera taeniaeformis]
MKRHKASGKKKVAIDLEIAEQLKVVKWPTIVDLLPIALLRAAFSFILGIPNLLGSLKCILVASFEKARREREEQRVLYSSSELVRKAYVVSPGESRSLESVSMIFQDFLNVHSVPQCVEVEEEEVRRSAKRVCSG